MAQNSNKTKADKKAEKRQRINAIIKSEEEGNLSFRKTSAFGIELRTDGYGAFYELGRRTSARWANIYTLEISEIKQKNEEKVNTLQNLFANSFVYGKENNFYQAKIGFGRQYILGQKGNKNGVAVIASFSGGVSVGLLKPYLLQIEDSTGTRDISYQQDSLAFLGGGNNTNIVGSSGFTKGWNQLKVKPGLFVKTALRFDFGRYNETIQAVEVGMSLEAYSDKIPIMIYSNPQRLFFQGHVAFVFGSRKK